ncbi:MAG: 1-deoxy-D-xylulose-5-phosphate synthase [Proteobacteria bacterium]|nr:1-deoxy-D-xylulose-5-phosphate synthase [Pseudomonadota bacterium]
MSVISKVNYPSDLKSLSLDELKTLADEIREIIVDTVSKNGGHLASSLGAVELAIAIHSVFNAPEDKIIWDVGHQAYAHKILTGRKEVFHTLRTYGGISGFPKREESIYDVATCGHSSTSISLALGLACGRDLKNKDNKVVAVIGDGSLTAGLALEGINNAGHLDKNLIIILNDNDMSISENVGALSSYLSRILTGQFYTRFRKDLEKLLLSIPRIGSSLLKIAKRAEEMMKSIITPGIIFEELGLKYVGPINGHDLHNLIETFKNLKNLEGPILVHTYTKKGKGYKPAEDEAEFFHGVPPFDKESGRVLKPKELSFTDVFGETLTKLADEDERIVAITAAMRSGTGLKTFADKHKNRFFDVGIAEQHAVTFSAGLALEGFRPFVAIYSTFLQRSFDMIVHDVCLQDLPICFAIDRAGLVGEDGPTHHGQFDLSYLRCIPNIVVSAPKDDKELISLMKSSLRWSKPSCIRYPRGSVIVSEEPVEDIEIGKGKFLKEGKDIAVIAIGPVLYEVLKASEILEKEGIDITVFNARFIKPLDEENISKILDKHRLIVTVEENTIVGGFGSAILEFASRREIKKEIKSLGLPDKFVEQGPLNILKEKYCLTSEKICEYIKNQLNKPD